MDTPGSTPRSSARRWLPVALLGLALGATVAAMPAPAQAADVQVRVLVDVADLVFRSGRPYYYDEGVDFHGKLTQGFHPILSHPI